MNHLPRVHLYLVVTLSLTGCLEFAVDLDDDENTPPKKPDEREPRVVELTPYARTIAAAGPQTCAIDENEEVICWGPDGQSRPFYWRYSELAAGQTEAGDGWSICGRGVEGVSTFCIGSVPPEFAPVRSDVVHLAAGSSKTQCYQFEDQTIQCFGLDDFQLPELADFDAMVGQGESFCGLKSEELPVCWGAPLPQRPTSDRVAFASEGRWCQITETEVECSEGVEVQVPVTDALQIAAGPEMVCVLSGDGALSCDGLDRALMNMPSESARFVEIAVGQAHGCGIEVDGKFSCWGTWVVGTDELRVEAPSEVQAF